MSSLQIIYASTSGHTEYVVRQIVDVLRERLPSLKVTMTRAESAEAVTFAAGDALLLASGSWNTGGSEGQMNPHMHALLLSRAQSVDLRGKPVAIVALGDTRYRYLAGGGDHMQTFVTSHAGTALGERLVILNEPYGQEAVIRMWAEQLSTLLA